MIRPLVQEIEQHFSDYWPYGEVHYEGTKFESPNAPWIELIIAPLGTLERGVTCEGDFSAVVQINGYGANKDESGVISDQAMAFLQASALAGIRIGPSEVLVNGVSEGGHYFYKTTTTVTYRL